MLKASCSVVSFLAIEGALPPAFDVEKNNGSIRSKSFSCIMRSIRTEPTMPRQPTKPTNLLISTPFQFLKQWLTRLFARLVWPGGARRNRSRFSP